MNIGTSRDAAALENAAFFAIDGSKITRFLSTASAVAHFNNPQVVERSRARIFSASVCWRMLALS